MSTKFPGTENLTPQDSMQARRHGVQYLYQLEVNQQLFYDEGLFNVFCKQFSVGFSQTDFLRNLLKGVLSDLTQIDQIISQCSTNWKISRIAKVDLAILRIATFELMNRTDLAANIILFDAVEIGKDYGAENSGAFVNGVLDTIAKRLEDKKGK